MFSKKAKAISQQIKAETWKGSSGGESFHKMNNCTLQSFAKNPEIGKTVNKNT